ncbi:MAG: hypothetical protein HS102_02435 [Planctomycetia bacterium]|nr:hypothetical protein [Planctomycetia bacterium]
MTVEYAYEDPGLVDQVDYGNHVQKIDVMNDFRTDYDYNVDDTAYPSGSNMLQYTTVWDVGGESSVLVSTTWYDYGDDALGQSDRNGNPTRIVTETAADPGLFSATHFVYDKAQRVWLKRSGCG